MLANAIAAKLKKEALVVNFPSLGLKESGSLVKFLFREARINNAPLFFDECESLFMSRDKGSSSVNMKLTELENFDDHRIKLAVDFKKPDHIMRERI
jgi:SpoVK/Ycf46/Vps4 family AAA+-type ATPase